ncbi:MAG: hypothetical protein H7Y05_00415 [Steroidobacteraceae bacterium]|nr:hypothetical protein [Deltaproteobacteria bacterium]
MIPNLLRHNWSISTVLLLLAALLWPSTAVASLSGQASLNYINYDSRNNSGRLLSAHSFTQDYSLLYQHAGNIYDSRIGKYNVSLGYNWSALDTSITANQGSENIQANRGHILFNGDLLLDPKEIPIKFSAFSRDLNKNAVTTIDTPLVSNMLSQNGTLLGSPNLATGINDGIHIDSGATLVAGVKNGMTNGYNEILRHFPMIMVDYRDQINRDLRATTPVDNRLSRLAFVSLNKKDNWFHYRYLTYDDYIDSSNNYKERQIQIGTIDHTQIRRWIDFSNWIQVSTDLQLTRKISSSLAQNYEEIDINLFAQAQRKYWEARSFNNFNRYREDNGKLTHRTTIPLYVSGIINPEVSWSTRSSYRESHDNAGARLESLFAGYRVDAFKRSQFTVNQHLDIESTVSENSDMLVLSGGLETTSSAGFSRRWSLGAAYNVKDTVNKNASGSTNFLENKLSFNAGYTPSNQVRITLRQENDFTSGNNSSFFSSVRDSNTSIPQYVSPRSVPVEDIGASSYRSQSSLSIAWNPLPRLNLGFSAKEDYFSSDNLGSSNIATVSASINYSRNNMKFNNVAIYTEGNYQLELDTKSFSNVASFEYVFNRSLDSKLAASYYRWTDNQQRSSSYEAEQHLNYNYYSNSGIARKTLELNETLMYSDSSIDNVSSAANAGVSNSRPSKASLTLGFKYYPLRQLVLAGGTRYQYENKLNNYSLMWYSSVGTNFRLFQASLDYYQGKRHADGLIEKKLTANVKKSF